jgi:hypothetical protein
MRTDRGVGTMKIIVAFINCFVKALRNSTKSSVGLHDYVI